jgi:hypothetical protein
LPSFDASLKELIAPLDKSRHAIEIGRLKVARSFEDLDRMAKEAGGWLTPGSIDPRLRLVQHNVRIFLVVEYKDGWSTRVSMASF